MLNSVCVPFSPSFQLAWIKPAKKKIKKTGIPKSIPKTQRPPSQRGPINHSPKNPPPIAEMNATKSHLIFSQKKVRTR